MNAKTVGGLVLGVCIFVSGAGYAGDTPGGTSAGEQGKGQTTTTHRAASKSKTSSKASKASKASHARQAKRTSWAATHPERPIRTQWLAVDIPGVMAAVRGNEIGQPSSKPRCMWTTKLGRFGRLFRAVDAHGQPSGTLELVSKEPGVTSCDLPKFSVREGSDGAGLVLPAASEWHAPTSLEWKPTADEKKTFDAFGHAAEELFTSDGDARDGRGAAPSQRAIFWELKKSESRAASHAGLPTRWAAMGGSVLVVAYQLPNGTWKADMIKGPTAPRTRYMVRAVFDMNGDAFPEIVYQQMHGEHSAHAVLSKGDFSGTREWTQMARVDPAHLRR